MNNNPAIYSAVRYMERNLRDSVTIRSAADSVHYSLFHFCRIFNEVTRHPPYDYLMRRRLTEAAADLLNTRRKIIEIALDYEFRNPETFSRAFQRLFKMPPRQWRQSGSMDSMRMFRPRTREYFEYLQREDPTRTPEKTSCTVGISGMMLPLQSRKWDIPQCWQRLLAELKGQDIDYRGQPGTGVLFYPEDGREAWYMAGVPVENLPEPEGILVSRTFPDLQQVSFSVESGFRDLEHLQTYAWQTWLARSEFEMDAVFEFHFVDDISRLKEDVFEWRLVLPVKQAAE